MSEPFAMFVSAGTPSEEVRRIAEESKRRREAGGPMELSIEQQADLEKVVIKRRESDPSIVGEAPCHVEAVWRLTEDDLFFKSGVFRDIPKQWPRCIARAEFNGYWDDEFLTADGHWRHRDDKLFGTWLTPIEYGLQSIESDITFIDSIDSVPADMDLLEAVLAKHNIGVIDGKRLSGWGMDPQTGWQDTTFLRNAAGEYLTGATGFGVQGPWRFRILTVQGQPWSYPRPE